MRKPRTIRPEPEDECPRCENGTVGLEGDQLVCRGECGTTWPAPPKRDHAELASALRTYGLAWRQWCADYNEAHPRPSWREKEARTAWETARKVASAAWRREYPRPAPTPKEAQEEGKLKALNHRLGGKHRGKRPFESVGRLL